MNCPECRDWLQRRLDGETLASLPALEAHLASCPACRQQHQAAQVLLDGMRGLSKPTANPDLERRIVTRVLADRQARRERFRLRVWTTAALAACLMLMALAGYLWFPNKNKDPFAIKPPDKEPPAGPSLGESVQEARLALSSLTERLADKSKEQALMWLSFAKLPNPMGLPEQPLDPQTLSQAGQGASEGIQTVAHSARRAVNYFLRELPPLESSVKN
ncbi:MAG TPA: zf-HC2 domain-containing protein [Gemmataceae bacterium]|nr:zf-HC2 domain-containing protein [Gemmataceae bacterium]